jgi:hypothetical protein
MYDPGEPVRAGPGMRGGYNSDLDGDGEASRTRPTDRYFNGYNMNLHLPRPGPQRRPHPDTGGTHEGGHDIPHVPPPNPRSDSDNHRRRPSRHHFQPAAPPLLAGAPTVQSGCFFSTKRQKMREDESRS